MRLDQRSYDIDVAISGDGGLDQRLRPAPQPTAAVPATENPEPPEAEGDELGALSPVAAKWMRRNSLAEDELGKLYSIDLEEIDLIANEVPGDNKRAKAQNVLRLLGIGEYLASGAPFGRPR